MGESVSVGMLPAAALMAAGTYLLVTERHAHLHRHERAVHSHLHSADEHHSHRHDGPAGGAHAHQHVHEAFEPSSTATPITRTPTTGTNIEPMARRR